LGMMDDGRILGVDEYNLDQEEHLFEFSLDAKNPSLYEYAMHPPFAMSIYTVALSPDGQHLAWIVMTRKGPGRLWDYLQRWLHWHKPADREAIEIMTSHPNGSDMHSMGYLPYSSTASPYQEIPESLKWLPDSKSLSFEYKDSLWVLPVM